MSNIEYPANFISLRPAHSLLCGSAPNCKSKGIRKELIVVHIMVYHSISFSYESHGGKIKPNRTQMQFFIIWGVFN